MHELLRTHDAALVAADPDEVEDPGSLLTPTASWGYLRLRRTEYEARQLEGWAGRIEACDWDTAWVFFKHEDEGKGPAFARQFITALR